MYLMHDNREQLAGRLDRSGQTGEIGEAVWLFVPLYLHATEGLCAWAPGEYPSNRDTPCLIWMGVSTTPLRSGH